MLYTVGRETLCREPTYRGYGTECFKAGEELCAEGLDARTKGEGSVKTNAEELGVELNVREVPVRVSWGRCKA